MSDKEMQVSEADLKGVNLKETQTKAQESEMSLAFKCEVCNKTYDWPLCCDEPMELEGDNLVCKVEGCNKSIPVPECDGQKCKPFIAKT
ncbi:MAG: hypothetical protein ACTSQK_00495 [Candidatus Heimdallarchaeota archaeon]